jgi:hypothetical protein
MPARDMTDAEKDDFGTDFPSMNVKRQPRVTGEADESYNCIAWTIGRTDTWIDPWDTLAEWDAFYAPYNLVRDPDTGTIAIWKDDSEYTHGCVTAAQHGFSWESKCGESLRILHDLGELVGVEYGNVQTYYKPAPAAVPAAQPAPIATSYATTRRVSPIRPRRAAMIPSEHSAHLQKMVSTVSAPLREEFDRLFATWKRTWFAGPMKFSSDTRDRTSTWAYRRLLDMGSDIIPLVAAKLQDPKNFIAIRLYDDLQTDPRLCVVHKAGDPVAATGLQGRAAQTLSLYVASTK